MNTPIKKIKIRFVQIEEKDKKIIITPMEDQFKIDRPICFKKGFLSIEIDPKHLKIEETWDDDH